MTPDDARREELDAARQFWGLKIARYIENFTRPDGHELCCSAIADFYLSAREAGRKEGAEEMRELAAKEADSESARTSHYSDYERDWGSSDMEMVYRLGEKIADDIASAIRALALPERGEKE